MIKLIALGIEAARNLCQAHRSVSHPRGIRGFTVHHGSVAMKSSDPHFWPSVFPQLWPFGIGHENHTRKVAVDGASMSRSLLMRGGTKFHLNLSHLALRYSCMQQRRLLRAIKARLYMPGFAANVQKLATVTASELRSVARAVQKDGGQQTALISPALSARIRDVLKSLELVQGSVRGTEGHKKRLRRWCQSLQLWSGAYGLFFTLNPADRIHPGTFFFTADGLSWSEKHMPMNSNIDEALDLLLGSVDMARIVAQDPVAATRFFYSAVEAVLSGLLGCHSIRACHLLPDGVPSTLEGGVFGLLRSFMGFVEDRFYWLVSRLLINVVIRFFT